MKDNVVHLFILINIISLTLSQYVRYECDDSLPSSICAEIRTENNITTVYSKKCPTGQECDENNKCVTNPKKLPIGAKCSQGEEWNSYTCLNNTCSFLSDGQNCEGKDEKCGMNSYCKGEPVEKPTVYTCAKYIKKGETCQYDTECKMGLVCAKVGDDNTSKCIKRYSLEDGIKTDKTEACKSRETYKNKEETNLVCGYVKSTTPCDKKYECNITYSVGSDYVKLDNVGLLQLNSFAQKKFLRHEMN